MTTPAVSVLRSASEVCGLGVTATNAAAGAVRGAAAARQEWLWAAALRFTIRPATIGVQGVVRRLFRDEACRCAAFDRPSRL